MAKTTRTIKRKLPDTPMQAAFRNFKPNWHYYIIYCDQAATEGDKEMKKVMAAYLSLPPREQRTITPESLCDISGVKPSVLFAAVSGQAWEQASHEAAIVLSTGYPKVVSRAVKNGATVKGVKDREMVLKHSGFLPIPKGSLIQVDNRRQTVIASQQNTVELPSMEQETMELEDMLDETKLIEGGSEGA